MLPGDTLKLDPHLYAKHKLLPQPVDNTRILARLIRLLCERRAWLTNGGRHAHRR